MKKLDRSVRNIAGSVQLYYRRKIFALVMFLAPNTFLYFRFLLPTMTSLKSRCCHITAGSHFPLMGKGVPLLDVPLLRAFCL